LFFILDSFLVKNGIGEHALQGPLSGPGTRTIGSVRDEHRTVRAPWGAHDGHGELLAGAIARAPGGLVGRLKLLGHAPGGRIVLLLRGQNGRDEEVEETGGRFFLAFAHLFSMWGG